MIRFIKTLLRARRIETRIQIIEDKIARLNNNVESVNENEIKFKASIHNIASGYTANLNDDKSEYLKKYVEGSLARLSYTFNGINESIHKLEQRTQSLENEIQLNTLSQKDNIQTTD